ncbi:MAG: porin family protein [Bacteroidota bacterium]
MKIIQRIAAVFLFVAFSVSVFGQSSSIGFKIGVHRADVSVPSIQNSLNINPKTVDALEIGGFYELGLSDNFSIRPELSYIEKGFRLDEGVSFDIMNLPIPVGVEATTRVRYIQMPVLAKYAFGEGPARAYVMAGPSFGYAASANLQTKVNSIIDFNVSNTDINLNNDTYDRLDIAGMAGAGIEWNTGAGSLFAEARYAHSFTDLLNDPVVDLRLRNRGFGFAVGYKFELQ